MRVVDFDVVSVRHLGYTDEVEIRIMYDTREYRDMVLVFEFGSPISISCYDIKKY